jgi:DNA-binding FadR family transcriptional regulator
VLDYTNPLEVIEVRLATEPVMARLAALRASQSEIKRLQMLAAKTRAASDAETYERADSLFHRTIAEAARNTLFLAFFDTMRASQRDVGWRRRGHRRPQRPGSVCADAAPSRRRAAIRPRAGFPPLGRASIV